MKITAQAVNRFKAIEYLVFWEGGVNASRLSRLFGIQANVIGKSISQYLVMYPGTLFYDATDPEKIYTPTSTFSPVYISTVWGEYLSFIKTNGATHIEKLYGTNILSDFISPISEPNPNKVKVLLKAIRLSRSLQMNYRSRTHPEGKQRSIVPHSLVNDGIRWHCRAYCNYRNRYADFNLGRMDSLQLLKKSSRLENGDSDWNNFVEIKIDAHPNLKATEKLMILSDYGKHEMFIVSTRIALVEYTLQFYRLGRDAQRDTPDKHPLVVLNIDELKPYLFNGTHQ